MLTHKLKDALHTHTHMRRRVLYCFCATLMPPDKLPTLLCCFTPIGDNQLTHLPCQLAYQSANWLDN